MIKLKNIYKSFGSNHVLKDITININKGECLCIIGKSGVGKSIILKQLIGLMKPDRGEVHIDGKLMNQLRVNELQEMRSVMGMVFQFGALFDYMNIIENVSMPLKKLTKVPCAVSGLKYKSEASLVVAPICVLNIRLN